MIDIPHLKNLSKPEGLFEYMFFIQQTLKQFRVSFPLETLFIK